MKFTIWQRNPKPEKPYRALARDAGGFEVELVHYTADREYRGVRVEVLSSGMVTVEHETAPYADDAAVDTSVIHRVTIPGWEDDDV